VVVKAGKIIATGVNEVTATNDPTAHAEITAIRKACKQLGSFQLHGCEIYTSCEPCPMCLAAIYWARPDRLFFANSKEDAASISFDDQFIYREIEKDVTCRSIPAFQLLSEEAKQAFELWVRSPVKVNY
jgi:tRNA(Arg) A34 adenosine deaminase TadA